LPPASADTMTAAGHKCAISTVDDKATKAKKKKTELKSTEKKNEKGKKGKELKPKKGKKVYVSLPFPYCRSPQLSRCKTSTMRATEDAAAPEPSHLTR
jgi:hypothetical protein